MLLAPLVRSGLPLTLEVDDLVPLTWIVGIPVTWIVGIPADKHRTHEQAA